MLPTTMSGARRIANSWHPSSFHRATLALRELCYDTTWAMASDEALTNLAAYHRFDVVFSDVVMPGMNGIDMGRDIQHRHARLPVMLASGYSHVPTEQVTHAFPLLMKPHSVKDLSRTRGPR